MGSRSGIAASAYRIGRVAVTERRHELAATSSETMLVVLVQARELVRHGWTQGAYARVHRKWAPSIYTDGRELFSVDLAGAIEVAARAFPPITTELARALVLDEVPRELRRLVELDGFALERVNDHELVTKATALSWIDAAIAGLRG